MTVVKRGFIRGETTVYDLRHKLCTHTWHVCLKFCQRPTVNTHIFFWPYGKFHYYWGGFQNCFLNFNTCSVTIMQHLHVYWNKFLCQIRSNTCSSGYRITGMTPFLNYFYQIQSLTKFKNSRSRFRNRILVFLFRNFR
jgi:hypothetical protein